MKRVSCIRVKIAVGVLFALLFCFGVPLVAGLHETPTGEALTTPEAVTAQEEAQIQAQVRTAFKIPEVLTFARFKQTFNKQYRSTLEELVRLKLFMARAHEAIVSAVKYWYRKAKYHLRVNQRSDWTQGEIEASRNHEISFEPPEGLEVIQLDAEVGVETTGTRAAEGELQEGRRSRSKREVEREQSEQGPVLRDTSETTSARLSFSDWLSDRDRTNKMSSDELERQPGYRAVELLVVGNEGRNDHQKSSPQMRGEHRVNGLWPFERVRNLVSSASDRMRQSLRPSQSKGARQAAQASVSERGPDEASKLPNKVWVDHRRKSNCLMPVQDQDLCGACYAFASIAFFEWAICRASGERIKLSEQYIIDCGQRLQFLDGCNGGNYLAAAVLFTQNYGLELAQYYPFLGRDEQCPYRQPSGASLEEMGYLRVNLRAVYRVPLTALERALVRWPIVVNINDADDLHWYGGGVWDGPQCGPPGVHTMLMIGHGREDGEEYWLLRNSFGETWGEQGYMKLNKKSKCIIPDKCHILADARMPSPHLYAERNPHVPRPIRFESRLQANH